MKAELVEYLLLMDRTFFGLTKINLCRLAYQLASTIKIVIPFSQGTGASTGWQHLLNDHDDLFSPQSLWTLSYVSFRFDKQEFPSFFEFYKNFRRMCIRSVRCLMLMGLCLHDWISKSRRPHCLLSCGEIRICEGILSDLFQLTCLLFTAFDK